MVKKSAPFTPELRRQMIELVRSGRSRQSLAKAFEPTAQTRSATGLRKRAAMQVRARMARRLWIATRSTDCGVRSASSNWSATSSQKPRTASLGRRI
jgi:hypothetical protein